MYKLEVVADKLNVRNTPDADPAFTNWIGDLSKRELFTAVKKVKRGIFEETDEWYEDENNRYYTASKTAVEAAIPWWMTSLGICDVWNTYNENGEKVNIAVLDTGYNINNPEFEISNSNYYNAVPGTSINDDDGHGSYCASIIGARNLNNIVACAPKSQLFIGKVSQSGSLKYSRLIDAINWAITKKVDIISISYGGSSTNDDLEQSIHNAVQNNILVVSSIGDNYPAQGQSGGTYPSLYKECLAVGATDKGNMLSAVTMVNAKTEINAPGEDIEAYTKTDFPTALNPGTSQAAAVVAGICGLIISYMKKRNISYSSDSIKKLITGNADPVTNAANQKLISPKKIFSNI